MTSATGMAVLDRYTSRTRIITVMGVSGTGKSTLGMALAEMLDLPFIEGDDLHPHENIDKMTRGQPLNDEDRRPWLARVRKEAVESVLKQLGEDGTNVERHGEATGVVVACSALKKAYRDVLRGVGEPPVQMPGSTSDVSLPVYFVYLKGDREVLLRRMQNREDHFMKAEMLDSQLATLENPQGEPGVVTVPIELSTVEQRDKPLYNTSSLSTNILNKMNHSGHEGHGMPGMCKTYMLWNTQIIDTCIVFSSWHIHSTAEFILSFVAIVGLSLLYEYLRLFQRNVDARIRESVNKGKRAASPIVSGRSTPERGETIGLLNGRKPRPVGTVLPVHFRVLRAVLYAISVLLSCFLMLVFMTYNAYLIFAVVAGAAIGHYFFSGFAEPDGKGMACH